MSDSILNSIKKLLGIQPDYTHFDIDITMHINSVFSTLTQLGLGPSLGFMIEDATATWDTYLADDFPLNSIKTYMWLRVRLLFDPPTTSYLLTSMQDQIREWEWRLNVYRETSEWVIPATYYVPESLVVDGGGAD